MAYFTNTLCYVDNTPTDRLWTCMGGSEREREGRTECLRAGLSRMSVKNESSLSQLFSPIHPLGKFASERTRDHVRFPARSARSVVRACGHDALIIYVLSHKFVILRHTHRVHTITQSESLWLSANCTHQICTSRIAVVEC